MIVRGDVNGNTTADFEIHLSGVSALVAADLLPSSQEHLDQRGRLPAAPFFCSRDRACVLGTGWVKPWSVAVGHQSFKLSTLGGAKIKADVGASHAPNIAHQTDVGNLMSGGEH